MKSIISKFKKPALVLIAIALMPQNNAGAQDVKTLATMAMQKSHQLKIHQSQIEKAKLDKLKAYESYLPRISAEASYTYLNDELRFSEDFENLLSGSQRLLIKEQVAMQMAPMNVPNEAKVGFGTAYAANPNSAQAPGNVLMNAVQQNAKPIPPIQEQHFMKASINAQMMLFSGLKIPYSIKAASHQQQALELLSENEKMNIILQVIYGVRQPGGSAKKQRCACPNRKITERTEEVCRKSIRQWFDY